MSEAFEVRPAEESDRRALAELFAAVAEERDGIAAEPPVDVDRAVAGWDVERTFVAEAAGEIAGTLYVIESGFGFGEIAMMVAAGRRGVGIGTALLAAAIEWARGRGLHKLTLSVFPHNEAAIALYEQFGFRQEGYRRGHYRRGREYVDAILMAYEVGSGGSGPS